MSHTVLFFGNPKHCELNEYPDEPVNGIQFDVLDSGKSWFRTHPGDAFPLVNQLTFVRHPNRIRVNRNGSYYLYILEGIKPELTEVLVNLIFGVGRPITDKLTTEELSFNAILDKTPTDWTARLIYADWLDERDNVLGPGMRAMGKRKATTMEMIDFFNVWNRWADGRLDTPYQRWVNLVGRQRKIAAQFIGVRRTYDFLTAAAFGFLSPEDQAALLAD